MSDFGHRGRLRLCSRCGAFHGRRDQRYCLACHATYMRAWRQDHPLTEDQRRKDRARSYAGTYKRRGHLALMPCESCGTPEAEMHHPDYSKPLLVVWLCRGCHLALHRGEQPMTRAA